MGNSHWDIFVPFFGGKNEMLRSTIPDMQFLLYTSMYASPNMPPLADTL